MNVTFEDRLVIPAVAAPMFLISGPQLVIVDQQGNTVSTFEFEWTLLLKE